MKRVSGMQVYTSPPPPLTAGARFVRGFGRLGIVAGAIVLLIGLGFSFVAASDEQRRATDRYLQAKCVNEKIWSHAPLKMIDPAKVRIDFDGSGCYGPGYSGTPAEVAALSVAPPAPLETALGPFVLGAGISTLCGVVTFLLFWLIGWLCAGFTRD
jgi:hypothetical protein